jgi:hypothetical protein
VDHLHRAGLVRLPYFKRLEPRLPILLIRQLPRTIKTLRARLCHNHRCEIGQLSKYLRADLRSGLLGCQRA